MRATEGSPRRNLEWQVIKEERIPANYLLLA